MEEKEIPVSESVKTLGAAVGQEAAGLDVQRNGQPIEVDKDREARVADLCRRYAEGRYQVNPANVASRLVDDHLT
jgi:anti-sigma28 factor (negative regulator of flagellin synthesis)